MFHPSSQGIYCDLCGKEVLITDDQIEYYSINMKRVIDHKDRPKDIEDVLDMDFCDECHSRMRERVLKVTEVNNKKRAQYGKRKSIRPN